ncbi:ferredoxin [Mycolicibacterium sp. XJ1819]
MADHLLPPPDVDADKCVSYGLCHDHAAKYLEMDENGITRLRSDITGVAESDTEAIEAAINVCPAQAITWQGK